MKDNATIKVRTMDGYEFHGETYEEIVAQMHQSSLITYPSDAEYMKEYSERAKIIVSSPINHSTAEKFVNSALFTGLLKIAGEIKGELK